MLFTARIPGREGGPREKNEKDVHVFEDYPPTLRVSFACLIATSTASFVLVLRVGWRPVRGGGNGSYCGGCTFLPR